MTQPEFIQETLKIFLQVFFTLAIFSFLYKDNPVYRFAEHLFVGVAAGYWIVIQFHTIFLPNFYTPFKDKAVVPILTGNFSDVERVKCLLIIPGILGFMMFFKFYQKTSWLSRWPMAVVIGTYSGLAIIGFSQGDLIAQIQANLLPLLEAESYSNFIEAGTLAHFFRLVWNPILIIGVISSLIYFFFSKEHKGVTGATATLGIWFLMISFGASYGNTVMTRISLFIERADFLLEHPWYSLYSLIAIVAIIALFFIAGPGKSKDYF